MKSIFLILILFFNYIYAEELILPIKNLSDYNKNKALLGKKLFHDTRLSKDNTISCASCHNLFNGGDDDRILSVGVDNKLGEVNSPTVFNSRFNFVQFWNGRASSLDEQVLGPIHNPVEMDTSFAEIISKLKDDTYYVKEFKKNYGDISKKAIIDAIVEFEKALITPNSKFDRYLLGEKEVLEEDEKEGYHLFKNLGCISCHNGINIGGNLYQKMGVMKEYKSKNNNLGRYEVSKNEEDKYFFKVPSLRNIALTAPYFHDGKATKLKDAIKVMIEYQVGLEAKDSDLEKIEKFLKTLTGEIPSIMVTDK